MPPGLSINPIVGRVLFVYEGIKLFRQCLMGLGLNTDPLILFLFDGKEQQVLPFPFTSGFAFVTGPFVAGRVYPGYILRVVDSFVDLIATFIVLKFRGHETKFFCCEAILYRIKNYNINGITCSIYYITIEKIHQ
jgi:hypothetical protein